MKNKKPYHVGEWRMSRKNHLKGSMVFIYDIKEPDFIGMTLFFNELHVRGFVNPKKPKEWCGKKIIDSDGFNHKYKPTPYQVYERLTKFLGEKIDLKYAILLTSIMNKIWNCRMNIHNLCEKLKNNKIELIKGLIKPFMTLKRTNKI